MLDSDFSRKNRLLLRMADVPLLAKYAKCVKIY